MLKIDHFTENFILILVITSMFFPTLPIGVDLRFDDIMALLLIPILILVRPNFKINRIVISYFFILVIVCISTLYGYFLLDVPKSFRDLNEFVRILKPFLIIIAVSYCDTNQLTKKLHFLFRYGALLIIFLGFLEYFNILGIRKIMSIIYTGHRFEDLERTRTILTVGDPNIAAAFVLFFITYILQSMLLTKNKVRNSLILLLLLVVLLMTSSRTLLIVFAIILFASLAYHFKRNKFFSIIIFSLCFFVLILLINQFQYLTIGFSTFSEGTNTSMLQRYKQWSEAFELFLKSPYIGWGPAKEIHSTIVDNEHLFLLRRYGAIGYLAIINLLFGYVWVVFRKRVKIKNMDIFHKRIALSSFFVCILIFILMMTNNFFSGYQLMPLYIIMITIVEKKLKTT